MCSAKAEITNHKCLIFQDLRFRSVEDGSNAFTIAAWVNWYGPGSNDSVIFDGRDDSWDQAGFALDVKQSGVVEFHMNQSGSEFYSVSTIPVGTCTHIAVTFDDASDMLRMYLNGQQDNTLTTNAIYRDSSLNAAIGNNRWAPGDGQWAPFNGVIDELRIYRRALSAAEIQELASGCDGCLPPPPIADPTGIDKVRFLSFSVASPLESALRVRLTSLHHVDPPYTGGPSIPFAAFEGQVRWIGPPAQYVESSADPTTFYASFLQCTPYYQDWSTVGVLHVTGSEIVPSSLYNVEVLAASCSCPSNEANCTAVSSPLEITTTRWGNVESPYQRGSIPQPDFGDVSALVNKFKSAPGAPIKTRALLVPNDISTLINVDVGFDQISACVDAFKGLPYPFTPASCSPPPRIGQYGHGDCKAVKKTTGSEKAAYPCNEDDQVEVTVIGGGLQIVHRDAAYNCCLDDITVSLTVQGDTLRLDEQEILTTIPCPCLCCYDVNSTVVGLAPGEYLLEYCWSDFGTEGQRCHTEPVTIP